MVMMTESLMMISSCNPQSSVDNWLKQKKNDIIIIIMKINNSVQ